MMKFISFTLIFIAHFTLAENPKENRALYNEVQKQQEKHPEKKPEKKQVEKNKKEYQDFMLIDDEMTEDEEANP